MTERPPSGMERSRAMVRQATGDPFRYFAYAVVGAQIVATCEHNHRRRNGLPGRVYAMRCAEKMARQWDRVNARG